MMHICTESIEAEVKSIQSQQKNVQLSCRSDTLMPIQGHHFHKQHSPIDSNFFPLVSLAPGFFSMFMEHSCIQA